MTRTIAIVAVSLLAACQPPPVSDFCILARTIEYSASGDTPETKRQVREHNAVIAEFCK